MLAVDKNDPIFGTYIYIQMATVSHPESFHSFRNCLDGCVFVTKNSTALATGIHTTCTQEIKWYTMTKLHLGTRLLQACLWHPLEWNDTRWPLQTQFSSCSRSWLSPVMAGSSGTDKSVLWVTGKVGHFLRVGNARPPVTHRAKVLGSSVAKLACGSQSKSKCFSALRQKN